MGLVTVAGEIGRNQDRLTEVEFLVDTGSFYTIISPVLATELGIDFSEVTTKVITANSDQMDIPIGLAYLRLQDREGGIIVGIMEAPKPLLGATGLQTLGLKVNPVEETIERAFPFGPALL